MNRMNPERWKRIEHLYESALDLHPDEQEEFLKTACAGDESVSSAVKRLLDHREEAEDFFNVSPLDGLAETQVKRHRTLLGRQIGTYRIVSEIGRGGMGEVYRATDLILERDVALKVLPEEFARDEDRIARFQREAKLLASLSHPNIAAIFGLEKSDGTHFLTMELIEGVTLSERIKKGPVPVEETLKLAVQIADALIAAHEKGVVHRDLKPANIKIQPDGKVKVLDFGLAKHIASKQPDVEKVQPGGKVKVLDFGLVKHIASKQPAGEAETVSSLPCGSAMMGTLPYMSPEQVSGKPVDARSDIFSFGLIIFEMLTGKHPLKRESDFDTASAILNDRLPPLTEQAVEVPTALAAVIQKMTAKEVGYRYQSIEEVQEYLNKLVTDMEQKSTGAGLWRKFGTAKFVVPAFAAIIFFGFLFIKSSVRENKVLWARNTALPKIEDFIDKDSFADAYLLAEAAEKYIPDDLQLQDLMQQVSNFWSIQTIPSPARVYFKEYGDRNADWEFLGYSPIENKRISRGTGLFKIVKDGFAERWGILGGYDAFTAPIRISLKLFPDKNIAPNMVFVDGYPDYLPNIYDLAYLNPVSLNDYKIDKFEVTNKEYMEFVNAGGYQEKKYWKVEFIKDGQVLSFKEAMAEFVDKTGQPGPATWVSGRYPDGKGEYPVNGVSWYEAAAYAEFAGKHLPSVYHWNRAASLEWPNTHQVILHSNFTDSGTSPVGSYQGVGPYGTYDMAGNVREWCWNKYGERRFILGGAWKDTEYAYTGRFMLPPMNRDETNGFRCIKALDGNNISEEAMKPLPIGTALRDLSDLKPVSDELYESYCSFYDYEKNAPLESKKEATDDTSLHYVRETVSFNTAYDNERITAYIYIPKSSRKPYQPVIYFPGTSAQNFRSIENYNIRHIEVIIKKGRAAVFPVYWGTFQRQNPGSPPKTRIGVRDQHIKLYKDLARTIDYLETRPDFDLNKLVYYGFSWGTGAGSVIGAMEKRIKGFIFHPGGFLQDGLYADPLPQYDTAIFAPKITAPVLMINGKYDPNYPSVKLLHDLLGTPEEDIWSFEHESGHVPAVDSKYRQELMDWLTKYFGPVNKKADK